MVFSQLCSYHEAWWCERMEQLFYIFSVFYISNHINEHRNRSHGLYPARLFCPSNSPGKNTGVGRHSLLQGIFQTQGSNLGLLHCRWILYHLKTPREALFIIILLLFTLLFISPETTMQLFSRVWAWMWTHWISLHNLLLCHLLIFFLTYMKKKCLYFQCYSLLILVLVGADLLLIPENGCFLFLN